jgi:hypothetical protein
MVRIMAPWTTARFSLSSGERNAGGKIKTGVRLKYRLGLKTDTGFDQSSGFSLSAIQAMVNAFLATVSEGNDKKRVKVVFSSNLGTWLDSGKQQQIRSWIIIHNSKLVVVK